MTDGYDLQRARGRMLREHLARRGITDRRVLVAMRRVPREWFVAPELREQAYEDSPLGIGGNQTISQPYMVALMTQLARVRHSSRVLEIGTGSGYHAAILATIARHVWTVERLPELSRDAASRLARLGIDNVTTVVGNGVDGYPDGAPYDAIVVAAAIPQPPRPLLEQLADGGRLVIPLGGSDIQTLTVIERHGTSFRHEDAGGCRFVPFVQ